MDKLVDASFGLLVLVIALVPGAVGDIVFRRMTGINWREPLYRTALRWVGLSIAGLTVYVVAAAILDVPPPIYLLPSTYQGSALDVRAIPRLLVPFAGHVVSAVISAPVIGGALRLLSRLWPEQPYSAWDVFVATYAPRHWVVVGLRDGSVYMRMVRFAERAVKARHRDLVLEEPALRDTGLSIPKPGG